MARKKKSSPPENGTVDKARLASLDKAMGEITKRFGDGSIMKMGEAHHMHVEAIPTGCLSLDLALGIGGIPRGRVTEIYGPESSGKTTLCLHIIAEAQKMGGTAAFIDMEHALDPVYAGRLGVDVDNLLISQPDMGEQALEITETLVRSGAIDIIVIDSVAALVPRSELEGDMGDATNGRPGPPDVSGLAQALRCHQTHQHRRHLHQPAPPKDRRHVRQPRNHHRRQRPQILRLCPYRHPPHAVHQDRQ